MFSLLIEKVISLFKLVFLNQLEDIGGYNEKSVAKVLKKHNYLNVEDNKLTKRQRISVNNQRIAFYSIKQSILSFKND